MAGSGFGWQAIGTCLDDRATGVDLSRVCLAYWSRPRMALLPKSLGDLQRIDIEILPPDHFIASLMQLAMMAAAERVRHQMI